MPDASPWPVEIRLKKSEKRLEVDFDDGTRIALPAEYLRVYSPSAEVRGHGPGQEQLVWGRRQVGIASLEQVGNYGVRIFFDDGHSTGLFTWPYLYELGEREAEYWADYLARLEKAGRSRDPRR